MDKNDRVDPKQVIDLAKFRDQWKPNFSPSSFFQSSFFRKLLLPLLALYIVLKLLLFLCFVYIRPKTTDINKLLTTYGLRSLTQAKAAQD